MRLIELILDGVPGTQAALRFPFQPGFNPWKQKGTVPLAALVESITSLLYPSAAQNTPLGPGKSQRAGMTFESRGVTYRVARDYQRRSVSLAQLEPGVSAQFKELSKEQRFITEALARSAQVPPQRLFRSLLIARPGRFLTAKDGGGSEDVGATNLEEVKSQLEEFRTERDRQRKLGDLEATLTDLQSRLFEIDEALRSLEEPKTVMVKLREEYKGYERFDAPGILHPALLERVRAYPARCEQKEEALKGLEEKSREWSTELEELPERPFWKELSAVLPVAFTLVAFALTTVFPSNGTGFWVFLTISAAGFGLASLRAFGWARRMERIKELRSKLRGLDAEKAGIEKRFDIETLTTKKFFETVGLSDVDEIEEALKRREQLKMEITRLSERILEIEKKVPETEFRKKREETEGQIREVEDETASIPPPSTDPNTLERKIRDLELLLAQSGVPTETTGSSAASEFDEEVGGMIAAAAEYLDRPVPEVLARVQKGIASNIAILTERRFMGIDVGRGRIAAFRRADGTAVSWEQLDGESKLALHFSIQYTLWQLLTAERPVPIIVEGPQAVVPEKLFNLILSASRHLSKATQVLFLAS